MRSEFLPKQLAQAIALTALSSGIAIAQESSFALEEVVVTAQKRSENIQDVPISISAVSGAKIAEAGIKDMDDLAAYVPNLDISTGNNTQIRMRGLGSGLNKGFEQSVGMYIDGVYHGRDRSYRGSLLDLERVEVLRGPQGILFGKNTIAGAINIATAKPSSDFSGELGFSLGSDELRKAHAVINGSLSETVYGRVALMGSSQDAQIDNSLAAPGGVETDDRMIRASLLWDASEDLEVSLKIEQGRFERAGTTYQVTDSGVYTDAYFAQFAPSFESNFDELTHIDNTLGEQGENTESDNLTLNAVYSLGSHSLTSTTAYIGFESQDGLDTDFSPVPLLFNETSQDFSQFSQEIRLASEGGELLDYIIGFYYQNSDLKYRDHGRYNLQPIAVPAQAGSIKTFNQDSESFAVFSEATWNVSEVFSVTAGLRYASETKEASSALSIVEFNGQPASLATAGLMQAFGYFAHQQEAKRSESNITPLIKFSYFLTDDVMFYGTASTGFKGGGFNTEVLNPATSPLEFDNEKSKAVEFGVKSTLLDGAAQFNVAIFRTEFEDLQVSGYDGLAFIVGNAAEATSQGIEMDGMWRINENLTIGGSYAYLDSSYGSYDNAPCTFLQKAQSQGVCEQDLSGQTLHYAPENTANINVSYEFDLNEDYSLELAADANYSDDFLLQTDLDPEDSQEAFTKFNARIVLRNTASDWELSLLGKNLSNEYTANNGVDIPLLEGGTHIKNTLPLRSLALQFLSRF
ncbi:MAG: TonB-dependent receptor [Cellvibrionaceae bacterium]|nr:TonB-dependent receptor [Cellvibrionaceae bacterium]